VRQLIVFCLVGALLAGLYFVFATVESSIFGIEPATASGIAYLLMIPVAYFSHRMVTFRSSALHRIAFPRFVVTSCVGVALSWLIPRVASQVFALPHWLAFVAVIMVVPLLNFVTTRVWVFVGSHGASNNALQ
jgi:putative flippase GtrA